MQREATNHEGAPLRHASLFTGTGGLDMAAAAVLGGELAWMADHYPAARRVLAARYPGVRQLGDLASVDWSTVERADVVTAGFPCQKLSLLGKREGLRPRGETGSMFDEPPSGWDLTLRALRALRPTLVILENVSAILTAPLADGDRPGTAFGALLADLDELGLDAEWACVDASAAGAPHRRRRWFLVAADPERFRRGAWRDRHEQGEPVTLGWDDAPGGPVGADWSAEPVWRDYGPALERWARELGRGAPHPVLNRARNHDLWPWLMGLPEGWLTAPGVSPAEVIRMSGNAVVPHQAAAVLPVLLERLVDGRAVVDLDELPAVLEAEELPLAA